HAAARHDLRCGDRSRRGRPGPLGPRRLRRRARARPGSGAARGRIDRRAGADAGAARLRPRHPAAALYPHGRGVGHGPTALRRAAGGDGLGSDGAPHAGPAGEVSRPYGPASASEGEDRLERKEAMTSVRHHPTAALAAIICLGMPGAVAAQGQAPLEVTLADEELVRVPEAQVPRARQQLQISVTKFPAGAATRSDALPSTVDLGTAQLNLLQAQASLATAQAALGRQLGVDQRVRALPDTT